MKKLILLFCIILLLSCEKEEDIPENCWICDIEQNIAQRNSDPDNWIFIQQERICGDFPSGTFQYKSVTRRYMNCIENN